MNNAQANSKSESRKSGEPATEEVRETTLEDIVRLTGKDPLIALAEVASGRLECTGCNGAGRIQSEGGDQTCPRCQGTRRETVPSTVMLNARHKLATFFYAPRKAEEASEPEETSEAEGQPPRRLLTVRFVGGDGQKEPAQG